jgi:hypothetical protein
MGAKDRPLLTDSYSKVDEFVPEEGSAYLSGTSVEQRSEHAQAWESRAKNVEFVRVKEQNSTNFLVSLKGDEGRVSLRSERQLQDLLKNIDQNTVYLDITGLDHHVWAPLLRAALQVGKLVKAVYVEPSDYRFSANPMEGDIFDLSVKIKGVSPIPGFASLAETEEENVCFVPLLGFEGTRFAHIIEQVQPIDERIIPVVGIPGFLPQYPFHTYHGNQLPLTQTSAWRNVRYAIANCPFSLFYTLEDIAANYPQCLLKIAPIGTKPHGLGAVLYALARPQHVELIYDHPVRKEQRTAGSARLLVYNVSTLPLSGVGK